MSRGWHIAVDRGGTFTDLIASGPGGERHHRKVLAVDSGEQAALELLAELDPEAPLDSLRIGTTVATNALLTGEGARTALVVTRGFADLLHIGHQSRRGIFEIFPARTRLAPLHCAVLEVDERILANGQVDRGLDESSLLVGLAQLLEDGIESLAVALVHGYLHPAHELRVAELARSVGFAHVSVSHQVLGRQGLVDRAATSVADAFLAPVVSSYLDAVQSSLDDATALRFIKSSGGLCGPSDLRPVDAVLSGPAGGVVACAAIAQDLGLPAVLGLDMGGTSTDVCRWAGQLERCQHVQVQGRMLHNPGLDVVTVAAGGGSLLALADGRLQVGPGSAGASPGPACYGAGGVATVTDANLVLGRIQPDLFPQTFGEQGDAPLSGQAARSAIADCAGGGAVPEVAAGFLAIANQRMASAIAEISTARGHDPRGHALVAFGGAAGQHACAVARQLGITHIVVHPMAGVLSAHGLSRASLQASRSLPVMQMWQRDTPRRFAAQIAALRSSARSELCEAGADEELLAERLSWSLRYLGSDTELICLDEDDFEEQHLRLFGVLREGAPIEVLWLRIDLWEEPVVQSKPALEEEGRRLGEGDPLDVRTVGFVDSEGGLRQLRTPLFDRAQLGVGDSLVGPALISSPTTTVLVDPGWSLKVGVSGAVHLRAVSAEGQEGDERQSCPVDPTDPVRLELTHRRLQSIVTRMGELLRRVAWSTNIKERLDFSCAVFDATGALISNAPHIPVHLGAMGATVRHLIDRDDLCLREDQAWAVNDPAAGGSHLPDITVITPIFFGSARPQAFVACRAHHADVGGITPGSMPPFSRTLAEEGVLLNGVLIVDQGRWCQEPIHELLACGPYPARRPQDCIADLQAQVAANKLGVELLEDWVGRAGLTALVTDMSAIQENAAEAVQSWLQQVGRGEQSFQCCLDDGSPVCVALSVRDQPTGSRLRLRVDFAGTGSASEGNLNAPAAVVRAAVLYVVRVLIGRDIPLGDGCLRDVDIFVPKGSLLDPPPEAAVVGGNVETSQRVVDVLLAALGVCAASQGTMNNLCFGAADLAYYETICGGSGAGPGQPGDDAVHSHMTNTRITDVEVLEQKFPVLLREFSVRPGSGGGGKWSGGRGVRRVFQFGSRLQVSLLAQRRSTEPFGLAGGGPGSSGISTLQRTESREEEILSGSFERVVEAGDILVIETPGAGGYGNA